MTVLAGCTEEAIVAVDPDVPGATVPTVEVSALASELGWRDTTYLGYELPGTSDFKVLADQDLLQSRVLGRFEIPDSVLTNVGNAEIDTFVAAEFRVRFDAASTFSLPFTLEVFSLTQSYDSLEATWTEALEDDAWATPGGSLGPLLGSSVIEASGEFAVIEFTAEVDSVLQAWRGSEGEPGVALVVSRSSSELLVTDVDLATELTLVDRTDTVAATFSSRATTFIYDPPQPSSGQHLRLAALPSARMYVEFTLPESLGGVLLNGATINHAEVRFRPLPAPQAPFSLERNIIVSVVEVLADPLEVGPKVPVGPAIPDPLTNAPQFVELSPTDLAEGRLLRFNVTTLVNLAASLETLSLVRLAVRPAPTDAQAFGFWEFGSVESPLALQPELLMLVTPPIGFPVP
jgi:hypothetical protein